MPKFIKEGMMMNDKIELDNNKKLYSVEELKKLGFSIYKINQMVKNNILHKLNKRYYENMQYQGDETDFYYISAYASEGVICLMSAASYYNLTTYRPDAIDVAIHRKSKISTLLDWPIISVKYFSDSRHKIGVVTIQEGMNQFKIYDIEKTVIDIICFREKIGIEETKEILINYLKRKDRDINKLLYYAEILKCSKVLKMYLEVLI